MADDDDFDVDVNEDADNVDEKDEDDDKGGKPSDDERTKMRNSIRAARKERDEFKGELAKMRRELAELKSGGDDKGGKPSKDDAERDREADERAHARYRPLLIKSEATAALVKAGAKPDRVGRLVRLLDVDEITVDEKGSVDGDDLDAEVDRLKEEMPELFRGDDDGDEKPSRRKPAAGGRRDAVGSRGKPATGGASKSTQALARMLTGSR